MPSPILANTTADLSGKRLLHYDEFPIYRPETYGAVGDGVTDDTVAIQAAITAALVTGGTVLFGPKVYGVTATFNINQNSGRPIHLKGAGALSNIQVGGIAGTTIKAVGVFTGTKGFYFLNGNGCSIKGIHYDCNGKLVSNPFYIESCQYCTFKDLSVKNSFDFAFYLIGKNSGVYHCNFTNITTHQDCRGGMTLESFNISSLNTNVAHCTFINLNLYYTVLGALNLVSADNNWFFGTTLICVNGTTAGEMLNLFDKSATKFGAYYNTFIGLDGGTLAGGTRGILVGNDPVNGYNICFGLDFGNGLIIATTSTHKEAFVYHDTTGIIQANLIQLPGGRVFGASSVPVQIYSDLSALATRFQNWHAATDKGFIFSGAVGAGAEATKFEISATGQLKERARALAIGEWQAVAYNAANFTASAGTMGTTAGNTKYKTRKTGLTRAISFDISGISVSNAAVTLRVALPNGEIIGGTTTAWFAIRTVDNGGAAVWSTCRAVPGNAYLEFFATVVGGTFAISVANTSLQSGNIEVEVTT